MSPHAANRMLMRGITEEMVIETLENGTVNSEAHGPDKYEHQLFVEDWSVYVIVQVVVNEEKLLIVTVIDDTEGKREY